VSGIFSFEGSAQKLHTCVHNEACRVTFLNTPEIKEMFVAESRPDKSLCRTKRADTERRCPQLGHSVWNKTSSNGAMHTIRTLLLHPTYFSPMRLGLIVSEPISGAARTRALSQASSSPRAVSVA
jgi:hypothetical protein